MKLFDKNYEELYVGANVEDLLSMKVKETQEQLFTITREYSIIESLSGREKRRQRRKQERKRK